MAPSYGCFDTRTGIIMAEGGAALPWGASPEQEAPVEADLPSTLGLQLGARVEVLWALQAVADEGEAEDAATTKVICKLGSDPNSEVVSLRFRDWPGARSCAVLLLCGWSQAGCP